MPELTDDQLDGLFRKSAEEFDPPFDPVAWRDMKTRLDANDRTRSGGSPIWKNLLRWGLPVLLLLLLTGGGWYAYRKANPVAVKSNARVITRTDPTLNRRANRPQQAIETPGADKEPVRTSTVGSNESDADVGKQPTDLAASVAKPATSDNRFDKPTTRLKSSTIPPTEVATKRPKLAYILKGERSRANRSRLVRSEASTTKGVIGKGVPGTTGYGFAKTNLRVSGLSRKQRRTASTRFGMALPATNNALVSTVRSGKQRVVNRQESTPVNAMDMSDNTADKTPSAISETALVAFPTVSELTIRPGKWPRLSTFANRAVTVQPDTTVRSVVPKPASQRGLSVRVVVAPDLSAVGLKNFSRPGTNLGVLLEYRLAPRWSVQAGVLQSTKVYRSLPGDYTAPYGTWNGNGYSKVESVDGRCNMLDIPINLRYDIILRSQADGRFKSRWFVSGGATSYIMNQEYYKYNYEPHTYNQPPDTTTSTGSYGFSNINFSLGYERALSKRLSWQVEPFIKVPLKGIGYFKTNLLSTGAFFSIRYNLTR